MFLSGGRLGWHFMLLVVVLMRWVDYNYINLYYLIPMQDKTHCLENYPHYNYYPSLSLYLSPEGTASPIQGKFSATFSKSISILKNR